MKMSCLGIHGNKFIGLCKATKFAITGVILMVSKYLFIKL